eukprot:TRINITY_DN27614_c0_g2_i1.p1 TRINITY_DN27614_c0_g2~~TRINITY_DN27614_c0_g2_i1.p1  ORF type:complete len:270 (-),score=30.61 TRINITY_DN27614_c0_g2_i1:16-825(-)
MALDGIGRALVHHRPAIWGGVGLLLCFNGGRFRHTAVFFPFLRFCDAAEAVHLLGEALSNAELALTSLRASFHPTLLRAAQVLTAEIVFRSIDMKLLLDVFSNGTIACGTLWLAEAPGDFLTLSRLQPMVRDAQRALHKAIKRPLVACIVEPMVQCRASLQACQVARTACEVLVPAITLRLGLRCDWLIAAVLNGALGVEMLDRALCEAYPWMSSSNGLNAVPQIACVGVGLCGLFLQIQKTGVPDKWRKRWARLEHLWNGLAGPCDES